MGVSHFPCCITNFPQGWPKFAQAPNHLTYHPYTSVLHCESNVVVADRCVGWQSAVLWQAQPSQAIVVASLLPLTATLPTATIHIASSYPFGDSATITVVANQAVTLKVRIPAWAISATVNGVAVGNGTLAPVQCQAGNTTVAVALNPSVRIERGWGDTLQSPPADAVAVVRGPLVFALHPKEAKTIVRNFSTTPAWVGLRSPDYLISTPEPWNYALDLAVGVSFDGSPSANWSLDYPFDDTGEYPFAVRATGRRVGKWGHWRGSNITDPPPASPVGAEGCGPATELRLVPFGGTNIRISVFPHV